MHPSSTGEPGGDIVGQHMSDYPIENGLFLLACHSLVREQSFTLPWIYRLKARNAESTNTDDGELTTPGEALPAPALTAAHSPGKGEDFQLRQLEAREPESYLYATYSELLPNDTFYSPPLSKTKRKTTYQCPSCLTKVWGKPELNIACQDCNCLFTSA